MKKLLISLVLPLIAGCAGAGSQLAAPAPAESDPVEVGIVALNDFHGALSPPKAAVPIVGPGGELVPVPAGGAAWLASAVDAIKARHTNNVVVSAGDMTSASQLASSLFLDEPAVGVLNRIGLEFNAVGNHEFDRGIEELKRLQNGGCEKYTRRQPCQLEQFEGAAYKYLAASTRTADGATLFPATGLKSFGDGARKVTVGFVGLSLKSVPELVVPSAVAGLTFEDEADTINRAVPELKARGADAVVVLIHQGGHTGTGYPNGCDDFTGPIKGILDRLKPGVDVVVSGHTHWQYVCEYGESRPGVPILLTSAGVYGKLVTDITLQIDPATDRVIARSAVNEIVQSQAYVGGRGAVALVPSVTAFSPRFDIQDYVAHYEGAAEDEIERPVGKLSGPVAKNGEESWLGGPLGNLIADAQLAATRDAGAQVAFMNPFGIRAPITPGNDGSVTFGQAYATQPFNNDLVTMTLTGAQLRAMLEQGFDEEGAKQALTPSRGMRYEFDMSRPAGQRVIALTLDGKPIAADANLRVTVSNFLSEGGDGFSVFKQGTDRVRGPIDIDAFNAWLSAVPVRQIPGEDRSVQVGG